MAIRVYQFQVQVAYAPSAGTEVTESLTSSLELADEATYTTIGALDRFVEDEILFFEEVLYDFIPSGISFVEDELGLLETVKVFGMEDVSDVLVLTDEAVFQGPRNRDVSQPSNVSQSALYVFGVRWLPYEVEDDLDLSSEVGLVREFGISQSLGLTDEAYVSYVVADALGLVSSVEWGKGKDVEQDLDLSDLAEVDKILSQNVSHTGVVSQSCTYFVESPCATKQRNSFHGEGGVVPADARIVYDSQFLLQSLTDPASVIIMRNPETDDRRRSAFERVNRDLYDGTREVFADDSWVTEQIQIYTIIATKRETLDALFDFLLENLGLEIMIKDWKGTTWRSIVVNPGEIYTEDAEGYWTIDFEVMGEALAGEYVFDVLSLDEELSRAGSIWTRLASDSLDLVERVNLEYPVALEDAMVMSSESTYLIETP